MKILLGLFIIFVSPFVFGQEDSGYSIIVAPRKEIQTAPGVPKETPEVVTKPTNKIPEDSMVFTRISETVGRFPNPTITTQRGFGYFRYADQFFYGLEYNYYEADELKNSMTQVSIGYRVLWRNRFLPYGIFSFGPSNYSDNSSGSPLGKGKGIATSLDIGVDTFKIYRFKGSIGIKHTQSSFNSNLIPSANFSDLYFMLGFVF